IWWLVPTLRTRPSCTVWFGAGAPEVNAGPAPARDGNMENSIVLSGKVFIGHGRSRVWKDLRDFLTKRLGLEVTEFDHDPVAGYATKERLEQMLTASSFAFLVATGEDPRPDGTLHARDNVIHEIGLFQGRLGFTSAIVLLEEGCAEFSNIVGL